MEPGNSLAPFIVLMVVGLLIVLITAVWGLGIMAVLAGVATITGNAGYGLGYPACCGIGLIPALLTTKFKIRW